MSSTKTALHFVSTRLRSDELLGRLYAQLRTATVTAKGFPIAAIALQIGSGLQPDPAGLPTIDAMCLDGNPAPRGGKLAGESANASMRALSATALSALK